MITQILVAGNHKTAEETIKLNRTKVLNVLLNSFGQQFEAVFIKKDKSRRKLIGRLGVIPATPGNENKVMKPDNSYLTVYDDENQGYRTLNLDTLQSLKIDNKEYTIV